MELTTTIKIRNYALEDELFMKRRILYDLNKIRHTPLKFEAKNAKDEYHFKLVIGKEADTIA